MPHTEAAGIRLVRRPLPESAIATRPLRQGDRSFEVGDVTARLRALGYEITDEPGFYGPVTRLAVQSFQQRRGLVVDGVVGVDTWSELVEASWQLGDRNLYLRHPLMRGDDVALLQARLNALGFDAGREDGIFGRDTHKAVVDFQKEYGIPEDAIFGPLSHAALTGLRADRPGTAAALREELHRQQRARLGEVLVVIDPGHGGTDEGEKGAGGTLEADLCWDVSTRLAQDLAQAGIRVRFTHTEAENPDPNERATRANRMGADLFVSVHLNAHHEPLAEGASAYYFKSSRAGEELAERVLDALVGLGTHDCRAHGTSYPILRATRMPAILVEPAFLTNPDEEKQLSDPERRGAIARAIATGVRAYFEPDP
ncbi:N-acetylmuramoyl-L-alanine amidase [soil metagenome]